MTDCYICDAVRTPRGKGKSGGGLNSVKPIDLAGVPLKALRDRNELDTSLVDDVIYGVVEPVSEQGSNITRLAVLKADYDQSVPGVQVNRFCSSGLEAVNMMAASIMAGQNKLGIGGGAESMSRVPMGSSGGPWATDPETADKVHFVPQGISCHRAFLLIFSLQNTGTLARMSIHLPCEVKTSLRQRSKAAILTGQLFRQRQEWGHDSRKR